MRRQGLGLDRMHGRQIRNETAVSSVAGEMKKITRSIANINEQDMQFMSMSNMSEGRRSSLNPQSSMVSFQE